MKLVVIESPYAAPTPQGIELHLEYARRAFAHSLKKGEAPFGSHLLYTQKGILDDAIPAERRLGIDAGFVWGAHAELRAVYIDMGISLGMAKGIFDGMRRGQRCEFRSLQRDTIDLLTHLGEGFTAGTLFNALSLKYGRSNAPKRTT